jgi:OmpA-OmpF porin, OOP family
MKHNSDHFKSLNLLDGPGAAIPFLYGSLKSAALLLLMVLVYQLPVLSQTVTKKVKDKTNQRVDTKVDQAIDKGLNKTEEAINNIFKKKDKKKKTEEDAQKKDAGANGTNNKSATPNTGDQPGNSNRVSAGFSDFVPGNTLIFEDNFEQDALGDFPAKWNTNGSGKIVTIDNVPGKWLEVVHNSIVNPVLDKTFPENCTIEFDLFLQTQGDLSTPHIHFGLTPVKDILKENLYYRDKFFVNVFRYSERDGKGVEYGLKETIGNKSDFPLASYVNNVLHVSMAVNKTRIRVYFGETKLIDLPRALTPEMRNNFFLNNVYVIPASQLGLLVSNIRIASAETDARSLLIKDLMEKGKAVTSDILFDVDKDVIKKESFSIIDQFGDALQKNPSLKIRIVGHTDADGAAAYNLDLSKKRAAAVKEYLMINQGIDGSRIVTDGKGATQPVAENNTDSGKAKNRRVEFVKL